MATNDLVFKTAADSEIVYGPVVITQTDTGFVVTNYGTSDLTELGFFIRPASSVGDVDNPAQNPPETDYQDLLTWGTNVDSGVDTVGGILINYGSGDYRVTRSQGASYANRIRIGTLAAGASLTFQVALELPTSTTARRFFVDLVLE